MLNHRKAEVPQGSRFVWLYREYRVELANGVRIAARLEKYPADVPAVQREWVQLAGTLRPLERFRPALREQPASPPGVRSGIVRIDDRTGGQGLIDIWTSTRDTLSDMWSTPVDLSSPVNSASDDGSPWLSRDGTTLYFFSTRALGYGQRDIWYTTRAKLREENSLRQ